MANAIVSLGVAQEWLKAMKAMNNKCYPVMLSVRVYNGRQVFVTASDRRDAFASRDMIVGSDTPEGLWAVAQDALYIAIKAAKVSNHAFVVFPLTHARGSTDNDYGADYQRCFDIADSTLRVFSSATINHLSKHGQKPSAWMLNHSFIYAVVGKELSQWNMFQSPVVDGQGNDLSIKNCVPIWFARRGGRTLYVTAPMPLDSAGEKASLDAMRSVLNHVTACGLPCKEEA